jgi:hypothetical protein
VYTLPAPISHIAYTNKALIYDLLFKAESPASQTSVVHFPFYPVNLFARSYD